MSLQDLHICKTSLTSKSETESHEYGPEYACSEIRPEDYATNSSISWQHFPRSTSTRSYQCDDSDESVKKPESEPKIPPPVQEKPSEASSTEYPITKSFAQLNAMHYLNIRHIFEFLNFLLSHLVCNEPEDPVDFLVELLKKCLKYRDSFGEPPLLFTSSHIRSLYSAFDPFERGYLTLAQYHEAMKSLGLHNSITPYNVEPMMTDEDRVDESYFLFEAEKCLTENLKKMLRIPKIWEENRLVWNKKMKEKKEKSFKTETVIREESEMRGESRESSTRQSSVEHIHYVFKYYDQTDCGGQLEQLYL